MSFALKDFRAAAEFLIGLNLKDLANDGAEYMRYVRMQKIENGDFGDAEQSFLGYGKSKTSKNWGLSASDMSFDKDVSENIVV